VACHFFVLECLSRIMPATRRTVGAVRYGYAMRGTQAGEVPALHRARKALADGDSGRIHELSRHEMICGDLGAHWDEIGLFHPELRKLSFGLDLVGREMAALGLAHVLWTPSARPQLKRDVAVLFRAPVRHHLAIPEPKHRDRNMLARVREHAGHSDFLCDHSGAHVPLTCISFSPIRASELDLDVDPRGEIELHERVHRLRRGIDDIEQALVRAHLELLAALLVDVRRAVDREALDPRRQRDRPAHLGTGPFRRVDDLARGRIEHAMIEGFEPYSYVLALHRCVPLLTS